MMKHKISRLQTVQGSFIFIEQQLVRIIIDLRAKSFHDSIDPFSEVPFGLDHEVKEAAVHCTGDFI